MSATRLLAVLLASAAIAFGLGAETSSDISIPNAVIVPAAPGAPLIREVPVTPETDQPPFGTVVQQWNLAMRATYSGAGITWVADSGKFYLLDRSTPSPAPTAWSFDPANPGGTLTDMNWVFPEPEPAVNRPWGLVWDSDSGCFWVAQHGGSSGGVDYLLRFEDGHWRGMPQDSWRTHVAFSMGWMGGMVKWIERGSFFGVPVGGTGGNNIARFDPYTKSYMGRLPNGATISERGCGFVPYDSLYIVTTGWNDNRHYKRDTTGTALQSTGATVYGPADIDLWVPQVINPADTVFAFCMVNDANNTLQKLSMGMTWGQLPSVNPFSVAPVAILAPVGAVDSGVVVTPRVVIRNKSQEIADSILVTIQIEDALDAVIYSDQTYVLNLAGGAYDTLSFSTWMPTGRDSLSVTTWTFWQGDSSPSDDTLRARFLVRTRNVGITQILAPVDTLDEGVMVYPRCRVYNYGTQNETFNCNFRIGAFNHNVLVANLPPNFSRVVTATESLVALPGTWLHTVTAPLAGDIHPEDNTVIDTFWVRGTVGHDVAVEQVLAPVGSYDTLTTVNPSARVANYGGANETFRVWFSIWDTTTDVRMYRDSLQVSLPGGGNTVVAFSPIRFTLFGPYIGQCSTYLATDQNWLNNKVSQGFRVSNADHDVSLDMILVPHGAVDSGAVVTPAAVVRNGGVTTENFPAYFQLPGGYLGIANVIDLSPGEADTVTFTPTWRANYRDSLDARAWTLLPGDELPENDTLAERFYVQVGDVGVERVTYPVDEIVEGTWMVPQARVRNYGTKAESFDVEFRIGLFLTTAHLDSLAPGAYEDVVFPDSLQAIPGVWLDRVTTLLPGDVNPGNNVGLDTFWVAGTVDHDPGVVAIFEPVGTYDTSDVITPVASVKNFGTVAETWWTFMRVFDASGNEVYADSQPVTLDTGVEDTLTFTALQIGVGGEYAARCSTFLATDQNWTNNVVEQEFAVNDPQLWPGGWVEVAPMPSQPSGKAVKRGGWLARDAQGTVYAAKGYKTGDFYRYLPFEDRWEQLSDIQPGVEGKLPEKGCRGASDGSNYVYMTKGNNTFGFWRYDVAMDSWQVMPDVPAGVSGKKVKGGTDLEYVEFEGNDTGYVYMLKGYKSEFYKYNTVSGVWVTLPEAPAGLKAKWDKGSWMVAEPAGGGTPFRSLYAQKAKYYNKATGEHELWKYDLVADTWYSTMLHGMPVMGLHSGRIKSKKAKDGGSGAMYLDFLYALKGGNTQQFFKYDIAADTWTESDTMPTYGSTGKKKRVKVGADIVGIGGGAFFALKGNKTLEMWRYVIPSVASRPAGRDGVAGAGQVPMGTVTMRLEGNPVTGGVAKLRYTLAGSASATVTVYDVTGRGVLRHQLPAGRSGALTLDVGRLSAGIYLVRLDTDGGSATRKLVIQH